MFSRLKFYSSLLWRADFCSPKDFVRRAIFLSIAFLIVHLAGLKDFTTILNGTMGSVGLGWGMSAFLGLLYVCAWLGFVVLAPILLLAAALLAVWNRIMKMRFSGQVLPNRSQREVPNETLTSVPVK
jgi:hypothetical protein